MGTPFTHTTWQVKPGREAEFREGIARALQYAQVLQCPRIHVMAGLVPAGQTREALRATYVANLRHAAAEAAKVGIDVLIEPINTRDIPGFFVNRQDDAHALVAEKHAAARRAGLVPILCVGETLEERERGVTDQVLARQLDAVLAANDRGLFRSAVVAYEPVWAIGTGRTATPAQAGEAHAHIRSRLRQWFGAGAGDQCRVLYGGSVKPENIRDLIAQADIDGALVGGASLDVQGFFEIVSRSRPGTV